MLKRFNRMACTLAALSIGVGTASTALAEENFQLNTISILASNNASLNATTGEGSTNKKLNEFQFEHFGLNKWGYLYFDLESYNGHGVGALPAYNNSTNGFGSYPGYTPSTANSSVASGHAFDLYGVVIPSVSLTKVTGKSFTFGPISDISLIARASADSYYHYRSFGVGPSFNFAVPGFDWFESGVITHNSSIDYSMYYGVNNGGNTTFDKNKWLWRTLIMSKPIEVAGERFNFNFLSIVNTTGGGNNGEHGRSAFARTELLWQIGGNTDYQLGVRLESSYHTYDPTLTTNTYGYNTYKKNVPFLMFKYTL